MPAAGAALSLHSERAVRELLAWRASANERIVSVVRAVLVSASIARSLWVWITRETLDEALRVALVAFEGIAAIGFSLFVLVGLRGRVVPTRLLVASVVLDALLCALALLGNPLFSERSYPGLLHMPDPAALLLVMIGASLRLSPRIAALGGALNCASFAVLVWFDRAHRARPITAPNEPLLLWVIFLLAMAMLTVLLARLMRELAVTAARRAVDADRARRGLGVVLEDHHDVRTLLSSAALNAELMQRTLRESARPDGHEVQRLARALADDLSQVNRFVAGIRERAYGELSALDDPVEVDVAETVEAVARDLRPRVEPELRVRVERGTRAVVVGGEPALRRVFQNLLVNACEGDGRERAACVEVRADRPEPGTVRIAIEDDGPGFPEAVLRAEAGERATTKPGGSGLGLALVETLLAPNGSRLERANRRAGGASVRFELPAAPSSRAG